MASLRRPTVWIGRPARRARVGDARSAVAAAGAGVSTVATAAAAGSAAAASVSMASTVSRSRSVLRPRSLRDLLDLERLGLLRGVRVLGARVDLQLPDSCRPSRLCGSMPLTASSIARSGCLVSSSS